MTERMNVARPEDRARLRVRATYKIDHKIPDTDPVILNALLDALDRLDVLADISTGEWCRDCGKPRVTETWIAGSRAYQHYCIHCGGRTEPTLRMDP